MFAETTFEFVDTVQIHDSIVRINPVHVNRLGVDECAFPRWRCTEALLGAIDIEPANRQAHSELWSTENHETHHQR